ncbi:hypothetical protein JL720_14079 [Aureococcus anophagefferens]|nr:hypothetical protein JL720_14079 [Aureococcus anophagefferens]
MKLTTERELSRNHEVTARSTSHCLCLSTVDFLDCMAKSNYKMLIKVQEGDRPAAARGALQGKLGKLLAKVKKEKRDGEASDPSKVSGALVASRLAAHRRGAPAPERDSDDDDDDDDSAAATVDALRRTVDRAGRAARRVVVDGDAAESPRSVEELKFQLRASINGDFRSATR